MKMYSFDVFDTLITRTTALPNGIFALMRSRMAQEKASNGLEISFRMKFDKRL